MALKQFDIPEDEFAKINYATIKTDKGDIKIKFHKDIKNTVANFATLAKEGFYDNLSFHRVIQGFMAQGGCPQGTGTGDAGYNIACETEGNPHPHLRGTLSMAHAGPNTGSSQFFICFVPCPHLDGGHTTFGKIAANDHESFKVLDSIEQGEGIKTIEISEQ